MKFAAGVEYDGSRFCGWQSQTGVRTVQDCVERALSEVANQSTRVITAGRTDAGVHACGQVIHFVSSLDRGEFGWRRGVTSNLPDDVAFLWVKPVADDFHARFCATERRYRYIILNRPTRPTYLNRRVTWEYRPLNEARMQEAAGYLPGTHDFSAYRAKGCQARSPIRDLRRLEVRRRGDLLCIEVDANAFLQHMVRNIAGVLMTIGAGEREPAWANEILQTRQRERGGVTAPPDGLYLMSVVYPSQYGLPQQVTHCGPW